MDLTITIPRRNPRYETGRVRVSLTVPAGFATATLTWGSGGPSSTVTPAAPTPPALNLGGNRLWFRFVAPDQLTIRIDLNADFLGGPAAPDYRTYTGPAGDRVHDLSLSANPTGYRLSGYCATAFANVLTRRVENFKPELTTTPAIPYLGRHPIDVALVLDRSESMIYPPELAPGETKWSLLKKAIKKFINEWSLEATSQADDRIALVWFETTSAVQMFGGSAWVPRGPAAATWLDATAAGVSGTVDAKAVGMYTAMGDGISDAVDIRRLDDRNDAVLVVLTDGFQNRGNLIQDIPPTPPDELTYVDREDGLRHPLYYRAIPMRSIGVGVYAGYGPTLDRIGTETGGGSLVEADPADAINYGFINNALIPTLKGDTLSLVTQVHESVTRAAGASAGPYPFHLGRNCRQLMVSLLWLGSEQSALDVELIAPDGAVAAPDQRRDDASFIVATLTNPRAGNWGARVRYRGDLRSGQVTFYLSVMVTEGAFNYEIWIDPRKWALGNEFLVHIDIGEKFRPLALEQMRGTIQLEYFKPRVGLGSFLHTSAMPSFSDDRSRKVADITDPAALKLQYYYDRGDLAKLLERHKPDEIRRLEVGPEYKNDIARFENGVFSMPFGGTTVPGVYRVRVTLNIETENSGPIQRVEEVALRLNITKPDRKKSTIVVQRTLVRRQPVYQLEITPCDAFGNYLGPGFEDRVEVKVGKKSRVSLVPNLKADGTYTVEIRGLGAKDDPVVTISVLGRTLAKATLSSLMAKRTSPPKWWDKFVAGYVQALKRRTE